MNNVMMEKSAKKLDVLIVGAGFSGLYMLYKLRQSFGSIKVFEGGGGVGGTWFWNRYPGAGSDIESLEYSYGFSEELQQEWKWESRYASQPELENYLNHVADRFDLRKDIQFNTYVSSMAWNNETSRWMVQLSTGELYEARFCVMATGLLSSPKPVDIKGIEEFSGRVFLTAKWPQEKVSFKGRRVGIIGTGSTAVQCIPIIAREAENLLVFQRTPNFSSPRNNGPLNEEYERYVKSMYPAWRDKQRNSFGGYVAVDFKPLEPNQKLAAEATHEERIAEYEFRWKSGGLSFYTTFKDILFDKEQNEILAEFFRDKIRSKIDDPEVAKKLIPTGYPILTKRLPADEGYFETFNRANVELIDIYEDPIDCITATGVSTEASAYEIDDLIIATGFDAVTGALVNMDIRGAGNKSLRDVWMDGPRTNAGLMTSGFPNMFFVNGPGSCTGFFNPVLNVEFQGDWISALLHHMTQLGSTVVDSTVEAEDYWVQHMAEVAEPTLFWHSSNWFIGANIPGKARVMLLYLGGFPAYSAHMESVVENGYEGFSFST